MNDSRSYVKKVSDYMLRKKKEELKQKVLRGLNIKYLRFSRINLHILLVFKGLTAVCCFAVHGPRTACLLFSHPDLGASPLKASKLFSAVSRMSAARLSAMWVSSNFFVVATRGPGKPSD